MILTQLKRLFVSLHDNEDGDIPVGPILVIGLIVIPLVIALVAFGEEIVNWLRTKWGDVQQAPGIKKF